MASVTWTCPNCNRRVPNRAPACHCGTTRAQAEQLEIALAKGGAPLGRSAPAKVGWDIKGLAIGLVVVAVLGLTWLFLPHRPDPIVPVLGFADHVPTPPPSPPPKTPRKPIPSPPFKLPWWK
ncbi:MAG: hypothetical protein DMF79_02530 [Acidobacteria bacterium]|nr:MAG: hypothetical protein DMF79_02530 [Acidobacteriota bacterium]